MSKLHVLEGLKQFIQVYTTNRSNPLALTKPSLMKVALHLLEELPASRDIVFEYFGIIAEISVQNYRANNHVDPSTGIPTQKHKQGGGPKVLKLQDDNCFELIQEALEGMVVRGTSSWSALIAAWSMELVGNLSDKYGKSKMSISTSCNYWLNCSAMRGLLTLISASFRKLSAAESESCVTALLNAFLRYNSTFDWVLARLGSFFPGKIISQLLNCCLKRFTDDYRCRFESEIEILDYLCINHETELKNALKDLFIDGFQPKRSIDASIIPFCLVIADYSDILLESLVSVFLDMYNEQLCTTLIQKAPLWMSNKLFNDMQTNMFSLALRLKNNGARLLISVAKTADLHYWCQDLIEYTLQELEQIILHKRERPILRDLRKEQSKYLLWKSSLSANIYEQQTAVRLLLIVSSQQSLIYYQSISELLKKSYVDNQNGLGAVIRLIGGQSGIFEFPEIKPGLHMLLEDIMLQEQFHRTRLKTAEDNNEALNTFQNLNTLVRMIKKQTSPHLKTHQIGNTLHNCLPKILDIFEVILNKLALQMDNIAKEMQYEKARRLRNKHNNAVVTCQIRKRRYSDCMGYSMESYDRNIMPQRMLIAHKIIELLNLIDAGSKSNVLRTSEVVKLAILTVKYFFIALTEEDVVKRSPAIHRAFKLLQRQCCARKSARTTCLRELLEGALFYYGFIFNQYEAPDVDELELPDQELVLTQNQKHIPGPSSTRTLLHAGVIGRGLRLDYPKHQQDCDSDSQKLFLKALDACCKDPEQPNVVDGYSLISLMLVELVSTDVMYNGLPFPDEEFTKVTMERDCFIRRAFIVSPVLWCILSFLASHRPSLCFSSVLLRGLCATCMQQWRAKNVNRFDIIKPSDELMQCTKKLLQVMGLGQLLPPPLSQLHIIIEHFNAPEIATILRECVWNYLKDHVPSPALFQIDNNGLHWRNTNTSKIPPQYVDPLRNLMQKKLPKLGEHYFQMFVLPEVVKMHKLDGMHNGIDVDL